jgi:hypothetical protein
MIAPPSTGGDWPFVGQNPTKAEKGPVIWAISISAYTNADRGGGAKKTPAARQNKGTHTPNLAIFEKVKQERHLSHSMNQPAFTKKSAPKIKNWEPIKPLSPKVQYAFDLIRQTLADGREHMTKEFQEVFKEHDLLFRYFHQAIAEMKPYIQMTNRGRGGAFYKLKSPQTPPETRAERHPDVARSSAVAQGKAPLHAQSLREKVDVAVPGYDPIVAIAEIANDEATPVAVRLECHRDIAKYMIPQVKAVDITTDDQPIALSFKWEGD